MTRLVVAEHTGECTACRGKGLVRAHGCCSWVQCSVCKGRCFLLVPVSETTRADVQSRKAQDHGREGGEIMKIVVLALALGLALSCKQEGNAALGPDAASDAMLGTPDVLGPDAVSDVRQSTPDVLGPDAQVDLRPSTPDVPGPDLAQDARVGRCSAAPTPTNFGTVCAGSDKTVWCYVGEPEGADPLVPRPCFVPAKVVSGSDRDVYFVLSCSQCPTFDGGVL